MKSRLFLIVGLVLFFAGISQAQRTTSIGLRGGLNLSNVTGKNITDVKMRRATNFGAFITHSVREHWGVTGEINYSGKGFISKPQTGEKTTYPAEYLEVPVYGTFYFFGSDAKYRPKVFAGPSVAYLLSSTGRMKYNRFDVGAVVGAGVNREFGNDNWLYVDVRYTMGFTNIYKDGQEAVPAFGVSSTNAWNRVMSVNVGVSFPLGQ